MPLKNQRVLLGLVGLACVAGLAFAAVSTSDFVAHLDRQVHGIHCSFIPGGGTPDVSGTSGCHATLMSPYSSVLRESVWGGIPVSLPGMAVFSYLLFVVLALLVLGREGDPRATGYLALATLLPTLTSLGMGYLSLAELGAACKLCIGIYVSSFLAHGLSLGLWLRAHRHERTTDLGDPRATATELGVDLEAGDADRTVKDDEVDPHGATEVPEAGGRLRLATASEMDRRIRTRRAASRHTETRRPAPVGWGVLGAAFALGLLFVALPVAAYAANAPDFERFVGACGTLEHPEDAEAVLVPIGPRTRETEMIEVLDPLCPSCRGFEARFSAHRAAEEVSRSVLLFPLDPDCNWNVREAVHPGACLVSEAILCAEDDAEEVLRWAFAQQEALREAGEDGGAEAVGRLVRARFPALAECIGTPAVEARLNRALRFAVANELPVLTPQVYVARTRLCDEDTDLGLDYVLARLLDRDREGR